MNNNLSQSWIPPAIISAVFAGAIAIFGKIGVDMVNSNLATALRMVVILVIAWGVVWIQGSFREISSISFRSFIFIILSGIVTALSWLFYFRALQLGDASKVVPVGKLSMVFAIFFAMIFLGEKLTFGTLLGAILITAGTFSLLFLK